MNINNVTVGGHMAAEVKFFPNSDPKKAKAFGRLIINRHYRSKGQPDYDVVPFVAWGDKAEILRKYGHKGKQLALTGALRSRMVVSQSGKRRESILELEVGQIILGQDSNKVKMQKGLDGSLTAGQVGAQALGDPELQGKLLDAMSEVMKEIEDKPRI